MGGIQMQQTINKQLNTELDRIVKMLSVVPEWMGWAEPGMRMINQVVERWKVIDSVRMKVHRYKNLVDFNRVTSAVWGFFYSATVVGIIAFAYNCEWPGKKMGRRKH